MLIMVTNVFGDTTPTGPTTDPGNNPPTEVPLPEKKINPDPNRKRIPSHRYVIFTYDASLGECRFTLPEGIGGIAVTLESEEGYLYYNYVAIENPVWPVTLEQGEYHIICDADNGSTFEGDVWID